MKKKRINIIGGGCAGYSFIRRLNEIKNSKFDFYTGNQMQQDHFWGFWSSRYTNNFDHICRKWNSWKIINYSNENIFHSKKYPYCLINKNKWFKFCLDKSDKSRLNIIRDKINEKKNHYFFNDTKLKGDYFFDSRKPIFKKNILLQHFVGLTIMSKKDVFDDTTIILMDFRCDQSKGLHFIYLIPFAKNKALVESTIFSSKIEDKTYYINSIKKYLKNFYNLNAFKILNKEKGIIPMAYLNQKNSNSISIGVRGGALRPSSGYTFIFIQKQITKIIYQLNNNLKLDNEVHNKFNLFMDNVFNNALKKNPEKFPQIICDMFSKLTGDEMALFMNGCSRFNIWLKIILFLPKKIFLNSLWKTIKDV